MATRLSGRTSTWRLRRGDSVLSAARAVDTSPVKTRLEDFERAHRAYAEAHQNVLTAEAQVRGAEARLARRDAAHDKAISALAGALLTEGRPIDAPFATFGGPPVKTLMGLPSKEKAEAVRQLAAAVAQDPSVGQATKKAAQAADKAARGAEQALVPEKLWQGVVDARRQRDVKAQAWDQAIDCLKSDARTVAKAGTPTILTALFPARPNTKTTKAPPNPPTSIDAPAQPTPPDTEPSKAA